MTTTIKLRVILLAGAIGLIGLFSSEQLPFSGIGFISSAEATVGRPLTPVSVAGVARCSAAGVYNC